LYQRLRSADKKRARASRGGPWRCGVAADQERFERSTDRSRPRPRLLEWKNETVSSRAALAPSAVYRPMATVGSHHLTIRTTRSVYLCGHGSFASPCICMIYSKLLRGAMLSCFFLVSPGSGFRPAQPVVFLEPCLCRASTTSYHRQPPCGHPSLFGALFVVLAVAISSRPWPRPLSFFPFTIITLLGRVVAAKTR